MKLSAFLTILLIGFVKTEECSSLGNSCEECIKNPECGWVNNKAQDRCINTSTDSKENVFNPDSTIETVKQEPLSDTNKVSPQHLKLKLRLRKPVFVNISLNGNDGIAPPHFENIIVSTTRSQPDKQVARIEALQCPKDSSKLHETLELRSLRYQQKIILDTEILCTCASN